MTGCSIDHPARAAPIARRMPDFQRSRDAGWNALLLFAFVSGALLRAWQIDIQILIDDEWHAVHRLLHSGPVDILTHVGYADYSIPLTLYYQWLYRTIGLSEWGMHVPPLVAGVCLLLVGPRLLMRRFALPTRAVWTALVAISPLLVYHSRVARPYALTCLLTYVAIFAFRAWWQDGRRRDAALYVGATVIAGWLHTVALPFALAPLVHGALYALRPFDRRALRRLVTLGTATALPLALLLSPPLVNDWSSFSGKAGRDAVTLESAYRTALMLAGTASPYGALLFWAAVAFGFHRLARRDRDLAIYLATVVGVGGAVVASTGAEWIFHPLVLARYLLPALPVVLLFAAEGIVTALAALRRPVAQAAAAGVVAASLFVAGPIPAWWHYPNQFWGHLRYQFDYDPGHNPYVQLVTKEPIPAFYAELARRPPGSVTLIETPWRLESHYNALSFYQDVHHQLIRVALVTPACGTHDFGEYPEERTGLRMRELVHLTAILRGDAGIGDYLVVHLKPANVATNPGAAWPDMTGCVGDIEAKLGAPAFRADGIVVFALPRASQLGNNRRTVQQ